MEIRYHWDDDVDLPHIAAHGVSEREVREVLRRPLEDLLGAPFSWQPGWDYLL